MLTKDTANIRRQRQEGLLHLEELISGGGSLPLPRNSRHLQLRCDLLAGPGRLLSLYLQTNSKMIMEKTSFLKTWTRVFSVTKWIVLTKHIGTSKFVSEERVYPLLRTYWNSNVYMRTQKLTKWSFQMQFSLINNSKTPLLIHGNDK